MRKALIAVIVATALFAVGAFAAQFTVQAEDIASGSDPVSPCAELVRVTFGEPIPDTTGGRWTIEDARATFLNVDAAGAESPATACDGFDADLALDIDSDLLDGDAETSYSYDEVIVQTDTSGEVYASFDLTSTTTYVDEVVRASVVVDDAVILESGTDSLD